MPRRPANFLASLTIAALSFGPVAATAPLALVSVAQPAQADPIKSLMKRLRGNGVRIGKRRYRVVRKPREHRAAPMISALAIATAPRPLNKPDEVASEDWRNRVEGGELSLPQEELGPWQAALVPLSEIARMAETYRATGDGQGPEGMIGRLRVAYEDYNGLRAGDPALGYGGIRKELQDAVNAGEISQAAAQAVLDGGGADPEALEARLAAIPVLRSGPNDFRFSLSEGKVVCEGNGCDALDGEGYGDARAEIAAIEAAAQARTAGDVPAVAGAVERLRAAREELSAAQAAVVPATTPELRAPMLADVQALLAVSLVDPVPIRAPVARAPQGSAPARSNGSTVVDDGELTLDEVLTKG